MLRLDAAELYWVVTTRRDGRPHAVPIGGVWFDDQLWLNTSPETILSRTLTRQNQALVHLESGSEVLIVEVRATRVPTSELPQEVVSLTQTKSGDGWDPDPEPPWAWFSLSPVTAMTWSYTDIRNTAVRYDFD